MNATTPRLLEAIDALKNELNELRNLVNRIPQVAALKLEDERQAQIDRDLALYRMDRDERNAELAKRGDLSRVLQNVGATAAKWILESPDDATRDHWMTLVSPDVADLARIEMVQLPLMVWIYGNRDNHYSWQASHFSIDQKTHDKLMDARLFERVGVGRGGAIKFYPFVVGPFSRERVTRDQLNVLIDVWPALGEEIDKGNIIVETISADDARAVVLDEWSRTPLDHHRHETTRPQKAEQDQDVVRCDCVLRVFGLFFKLLGYSLVVAVTLPFAMLMRDGSRPPAVDDGVGYDDNDPGVDVDDPV